MAAEGRGFGADPAAPARLFLAPGHPDDLDLATPRVIGQKRPWGSILGARRHLEVLDATRPFPALRGVITDLFALSATGERPVALLGYSDQARNPLTGLFGRKPRSASRSLMPPIAA
jgi:hypothetical protein